MSAHRRSIVRAVAVIAAVTFGMLHAAPASAADWNRQTVSGPQTAYVYHAAHHAATVWNNQAHVFYSVEADSDLNLHHAWFNGVTWNYELLDGTVNESPGRIDASVGENLSATVWNNQPHVFYRDATNGNLRHAWWNGSRWYFEALDGNSSVDGRLDADVGADTTVAVWNNTPHVWYRDATNNDLRHAWWGGNRWYFESLDGWCPTGCLNGKTANSVGIQNAASVWNGTPHVWYRDATAGDLRHAWWTGARWQFETLDGAGGTNGRVNADVGADSTVTTWNNQPHVWYGTAGADLRHAWWNGTAWYFETLDGDRTDTDGRTTNGVGSGVATVWNGTPHIWYPDTTDYLLQLRHGWWTGTKWRFEVLDGDSFGPNDRRELSMTCRCSVAIFNNRPYVWYRLIGEAETYLRAAWYG